MVYLQIFDIPEKQAEGNNNGIKVISGEAAFGDMYEFKPNSFKFTETNDKKRDEIYNKIGDEVVKISKSIKEKFVDIGEKLKPNSIELEFGVAISGKSDLIFVSGEISGSIKVKAKWDLK
jgi:hypothetical protein